MLRFSDWLNKRKKQAPQASAKPAIAPQATTTQQEKGKHHLSPEELDDLWQASADPHGLSDKRRKELIAKNNPKLSDERIKEIEDAWKRGAGKEKELTQQEKEKLPKHHMSPEELEAIWKKLS